MSASSEATRGDDDIPTKTFNLDVTGSAWTTCDVEGCDNVARRIITNPVTDEILQIVCEVHAGE